MGHSQWSGDAYDSVSKNLSNKPTHQVFTTTSTQAVKAKGTLAADITTRECRDSAAHPNSVPVIIAFDVTGSMGMVPEQFVKKIFGTCMNIMIDNKVPDASIMFMAVGDHLTDICPLQVTQFESGTDELVSALSSLWLEGNGGGQAKESYPLAWAFASRKTVTDRLALRKQKGFLFTIGDESFHSTYSAQKLNDIVGKCEFTDSTAAALLDEVSKKYEVFHIALSTGSYHMTAQDMNAEWQTLLGERLIYAQNPEIIPAVIAGVVASMNGADISSITSNLSSSTAIALTKTLDLALRPSNDTGIMTL